MEDQVVSQQGYLLDRILKSANHKRSRSEILGAKTEMKKLGLDDQSADVVLGQLVAGGYLVEHKGKGVSFSVTESGLDFRKSMPVAADPLDDYRRAYLLLQLRLADGWTLDKGVANKFQESVRGDLEMNAAIANRLRDALAGQGHIERSKDGKKQLYRLTESGRKLLGVLDQNPALVFLKIKGIVLNELRALARNSDGKVAVPVGKEVRAPPPENLSEAAYEAFQEVRREAFSHTSLVPIYAVRRFIGEKYGPDVARHSVLDDAILELWRQGRVRIIPINDPRKATGDQLANSIGDANQTLFYME